MPKGVLDPATPRCTAHKRGSGERCKLPAIKGGTVCRRHGGSAPQVIKSARERFNDAVDPAINLMHKQLERAEKGELTVAEEQNLMKMIFDRTGFVPGKTVNIDGKAKWELMLIPGEAGIIREVPAELAAGDVIDADVIEDDDDPLERHEREEAAKHRAAYEADARDRARAELPQISERRDAQRVGSAEPPQRQSMRSPWG
ncbi:MULTISPECIES: hypothetical protein [Microbacterium]|uniref:hypothetical protein n=1 Tax=Microbacterium TaxID=33882 RepID=UPI0013A54165|nr:MULTISPECIES: hypothetical protein [Microbacterium]